jgi:hypothetical protein
MTDWRAPEPANRCVGAPTLGSRRILQPRARGRVLLLTMDYCEACASLFHNVLAQRRLEPLFLVVVAGGEGTPLRFLGSSTRSSERGGHPRFVGRSLHPTGQLQDDSARVLSARPVLQPVRARNGIVTLSNSPSTTTTTAAAELNVNALWAGAHERPNSVHQTVAP